MVKFLLRALTVLSIAVMASGQPHYYLSLASSAEDYYLGPKGTGGQGIEPPGEWYGEGTGPLGLSGRVERTAFLNLSRGRYPDGERDAVQIQYREGKCEHVPGTDLTFTAVPGVKVIWSQGDRNTRRGVEESHGAAVKAAPDYIQDTCGFTRRGKGGREWERAGLIFALFEHGTSRAGDPLLHTHCCLLNVLTREDGTTGTLANSRLLYRHKMAAGAIYRAELSYQLEQRLGLKMHRENTWCDISDVRKDLVAEFSKRGEEIREKMADLGVTGAKAAAQVTIDTRQGKEKRTREELFLAWQEVGRAFGFSTEEVKGLLMKQGPRHDLAERVHTALDTSLLKITQSQSHFRERDLLRHTAEESQCQGLPAFIIRHTVRQELERSEEIVRLGRVKGEERFTTREMMDLEKALRSYVESSKQNTFHQVPPETVNAVLARYGTITDEQKEAVLHVTVKDGSIVVISGMAGTGKGFVLKVASEAWKQEGFEVYGACLAAKAARGLEDGSGIQSTTIHRMLRDLEKGQLVITDRTVVVVDEAGMVGTRQLELLAREVTKGGGKLVLCGDAKQLQPIEAGAPFKAIGEWLGEAKLTEIIRQRDERDRENVRRFERGDARDALKDLAARGLLSVSDDRLIATTELVKSWKERGVENPKDNLMLASTRLEVALLNRMAQDERKAKGELGDIRVKVGADYIHERERILFTRNDRALGIENGSLGIVMRVDLFQNALLVRLDTGKLVSIPLDSYDHVRLGYCLTTHSAQGVTVEKDVFVLAGGPMQDRELSYVQASRARGQTLVFTDRLEAGDELTELSRQMSTSRQKDLAHDLISLKGNDFSTFQERKEERP